ncbi:MAG: PAS domain S-box protein [Candidatus Magnetomorum sp.]|nr:PAS domain S-box protein [Candidatus Magnetomorum sp.]
MTIKFKLLFLIIATLLIATISILIVVNIQFITIINENQYALYNERVDTILGILQGYEERLQMTGQVEAYSDGFRELAIEALRKTYYQQQNQRIFPFIINHDDDFVMLPDFYAGDLSPVKSVVVSKMLSFNMNKSGSFEFEKRWYLYKRFDSWNWMIAYTVPLEIKYAEVQKLRHILISIMIGITMLSIIIMWLAIIRITRPIMILTQGTRAIAAGNYSSRIDVTGSGEIGQLARSFLTMRDHLITLFSERDKRITELESTKRELMAREKSLEQFAQRLALHIEQTPLGVIEFDINFRIIQWNKAAEKIFGYTCDEILGQYAVDLLVLETAKKHVNSVWKELLTKKGGTKSKNQNIRKNGTIITCEWYNTTLVDSEGIVIGVASLVLDISEAERLEEQLRQAHKMEAIGTLAGGIAHDFNNILTIILGYAEMAMDDTSEYSPAKSQIEQVLKAGNRAKDLVKQILAFSRKEIKERSPVQIHLLVNEALKLLRASIPTTIKIRRNIDSQCGNILADPTQIQQVLMNLCTNAAQSMDENGGILEVELISAQLSTDDIVNEPNLKPGHYAQLTVKDSGIGIDQKYLDRIFDPYFTTKEVGKGSGMGLAVVIGIVKSHDGMISVDSKLGKGTTFNVCFPIIEEQIHNKIEDTAPLPTGKEKILVVDDEESIVNMTKQRVERLGYQVTAKTSSIEALELFRSQPDGFDLVITDQTMPELTGEKLAKKLMEIRTDIPIIICTGYSSKMDAKKADFVGISAFIMKPVDKRELAKTIRQVLV